jgi:hypothetical protein
MNISMTRREIELLSAFLRRSSNYLEFGAGGSTVLASRLVRERITAVDSSQEWLDKARDACSAVGTAASLDLVLADIGPTGQWGYPIDKSAIARWPGYYENVWTRPAVHDVDFCLVDGRFRVACFLHSLLCCRADMLLAIHDFDNREKYHVLREIAREVAMADNLSVFLPRPDVTRARISEVLAVYRLNPD